MKVDYNFYKNEFHGDLNENEFEKNEVKARFLIHRYTFDRLLKTEDENIIYKAKLAICELLEDIELLSQTDNKIIASESVGNHSITYDTGSTATTKESIETRRVNIIRKYLGNTGLMFRGANHVN